MFKIRLFPILILVLGLVSTFVISFSSMQDLKNLSRQEFESFCNDFENKIQIQLKANAQILYSSAAFISSSSSTTREEWREFQHLNKSYRELPGIRGVGYMIIVPKHQLDDFEQKMRKEGFSDFKIRPEGDRDFYTSVLFLEPFSERNKVVLGYDAFAEPVRRKALLLARDNDQATISDKIILVQDSVYGNTPGTVMFVPVFRSGTPKADDDERKSAIIGWVFSPFRMNDLFTEILGEWDYQSIRLRVYDELVLNHDRILFDSDSIANFDHEVRPEMTYQVPLNFNGKVWFLDFSKYPNGYRYFPSAIWTILLIGLFISVLLSVLAISLINASGRSLQIMNLNEELKKVNANKDRFISVLAHDLKNPFNSLLGFSELLSENLNELKKDEIEGYVNQVQASAQVVYLLLEELLLWARVQSDQFPYHPRKINMTALYDTLIADNQLIAAKKSISVFNENTESVFVFADELMLKTILRNLLGNAIKFSHESGTIRISTKTAENKVIVSVIDHGTGMSAEEIKKLFDISSVYSKPGTANEKGTGLGLLLCKDLISKHDGEIWVESSPGQGSKFSFTLPSA
jgi:signal transduction histidine kinase